tara:strand:+ start:5970 stop:7253 length:1284 start_codon:yes stop_codon:yes gene_type:complete
MRIYKNNKKFYSYLFDKLFPIHRSIVNPGYNKSLKILNFFINFNLIKLKSGKKIFGWTIPMSWEVDDAYIITPQQKKICKFKLNNLHLMGYSMPFNKTLSLQNLKKILTTNKKMPNAIPFTYSFYKKKIGMNIAFNDYKRLKKGNYRVVIKSKFKKSNLVIGEKKLSGLSNKTFLISSYLCHPSMANNELSGPLVLLGVFKEIEKWKFRNLNYNFVINPETIGSIGYIFSRKKYLIKNLKAGLVLTCLGGPRNILTYKKTRVENSQLNFLFKKINKEKKIKISNYSSLSGSDERQYCSPGINLAVGQISRTTYLQYKEYHSSSDNKKFMKIEKILKSIKEISKFIYYFDHLCGIIKRNQECCETYLEKYNLYKDKRNNKVTKTILTFLGHCDEGSILEIIDKYNLSLDDSVEAINLLKKKKIIKVIY